MRTFRITALICLMAIGVALSACTENQRAKSFGGTMSVDVPPGQKLVGATWKEDHLWYLTRPMRQGEVPEISTLHESSSFGVMQGAVVFKESPAR